MPASGGAAGAGGLFALSGLYGHRLGSLGDVDGDGSLDMIGLTGDLNSVTAVTVWKGRGDGTFAATAVMTTLSPPQGYAAAQGEFDGDGAWDIAFLTSPDPLPGQLSFRVAHGRADGTFALDTLSWPVGSPSGLNTTVCAVADFNSDGQSDMLVVGREAVGGGLSYAWLNNSLGVVGVKSLGVGVGQQGMFSCGYPADADGDGNLDVPIVLMGQGVGGAATPSRLVIAYASRDGTLTASPPIAEATEPDSASLYDLDADGRADLFVDGRRILWNNGDGTFATGPQLYLSYVGDFDADCRPDLLANSTPSSIVFGDGARGFGRMLAPPGGGFVADLNHDGASDLLFTPVQGVTAIYLSTARGASVTAPDVACGTVPVDQCTAPARF